MGPGRGSTGPPAVLPAGSQGRGWRTLLNGSCKDDVRGHEDGRNRRGRRNGGEWTVSRGIWGMESTEQKSWLLGHATDQSPGRQTACVTLAGPTGGGRCLPATECLRRVRRGAVRGRATCLGTEVQAGTGPGVKFGVTQLVGDGCSLERG